MTVSYRTKAFTFKKKDSNEADRVFNVFSDDFGKLEIFAKAIRKINSKLKSGIDLFYLSEIEFIEGKNRKTLIDTNLIKRFENIESDLEKFKTAKRISKIIDNFIKGQQKDQSTFDLLGDALDKLDKSEKAETLYGYFLWNFLSNQGYKPEVSRCACCKDKLNPYSVYFSCKEGGIICKKCLAQDNSAKKVNSDVVKILRIILDKDWQTFSKLKIEPHSRDLFIKTSDYAVENFCPV